MEKKLSFEDSILTEESTSVKPYTYRAKVLRGIDIVLKEDYNGKPIKKWECANYEQARKLALKLMKQSPLPEPFEEGEKIARQCSVTNEGMNEGWVTTNDGDYFKYEEDALAWCKENKWESIAEAYDDDAIYWTEWYDENCDDYQYIIKDGKVVEIEEEEEQKVSKEKIFSIENSHQAISFNQINIHNPEGDTIIITQDDDRIAVDRKSIKMLCAILLQLEHE